MREKITKHEHKNIYKLPKFIENGWHVLDFEEDMGILQFWSVIDKENPCIIKKKLSVCAYWAWLYKYNSNETDLAVEKIRISKKNSVSGEKIISYSLQIWKMWMRTFIKVMKIGKNSRLSTLKREITAI